MSVSPMEPTARLRKSRTRTKKVSAREALTLSPLAPHTYDLRPACASLVCPDCKTWVPITGIQAKVQKLVPHHGGTARKDAPIRCPGSNRRVIVDVTFQSWQRRMEQGGAETAKRRSARQHYKPNPAPAAPIARMSPAPVSAAAALTAYREHFKICRASKVNGSCDDAHHCADGARLAKLYEQLLRTQPHRDREQEAETRRNALRTRSQVSRARKTATAEWAEHRAETADAKTTTAKRSGTQIEEANNVCKRRSHDSVSDYRGLDVPVKPLHITA